MFKEVKKLMKRKEKINILRSLKKKSVYYELNLSFKTFFQIWYYDGNHQSVIREFYGDHFLLESSLHPSVEKIVLKAYINNPLKKTNGQIRICIQIEERTPQEKVFDIDTDLPFKNKWYSFSVDL